MQQGWFVIKHQTCIAKDVYEMDLSGDTTAITAAGQFVNIRIDGCYLRRPISVCAVDTGVLRLIYKVVGAGTKCLSEKSWTCSVGWETAMICHAAAPHRCSSAAGSVFLRCMRRQNDCGQLEKRSQYSWDFEVRAMYFIRSNFRRWGARYVWPPRTDRAAHAVL